MIAIVASSISGEIIFMRSSGDSVLRSVERYFAMPAASNPLHMR